MELLVDTPSILCLRTLVAARFTLQSMELDAPNFDSVARAYRWMEYFSFGPMLEHCRFHFLTRCSHARHALVLGDGDGRFTARLLALNPAVRVDAIDASSAMLDALRERARRSCRGADTRLSTTEADIRRFTPTGNDYELVVSHFFLDCLTDDDVAALLARISPHQTPGCNLAGVGICGARQRMASAGSTDADSLAVFRFLFPHSIRCSQYSQLRQYLQCQWISSDRQSDVPGWNIDHRGVGTTITIVFFLPCESRCYNFACSGAAGFRGIRVRRIFAASIQSCSVAGFPEMIDDRIRSDDLSSRPRSSVRQKLKR